MGIFNKIKKKLSSLVDTDNKKAIVEKESKAQRESAFTLSARPYFQPVKQIRYTNINSFILKSETIPTWKSFFSLSKTNPKLIGFEQRSRRKFKHLFNDENVLIAEAANIMEVVTKAEIKRLFLKDTPLEKLSHVTTNHTASIFHKNQQVSFVNHQENKAIVFEFKFQPFRFSLGKDFWVVGTRETYDGPGELYCFDYEGQLKWAIEFKEKISSLFGEILFMPYLVGVSTDSTDIFVASMDRLYRLDSEGRLKARIAISELKESELRKKQEEFQRTLSKSPQTEKEAISLLAEQLAYEFSLSFERMDHSSPFAGFAHDPETDMVFILEEQGRVSAWSDQGKMVWINTFKNEGRYISWIDNKIVISFKTGETFWMTRDGKIVYGARLPNQAVTIGLIPKQEKYLIVNEDNRLYELHKTSGELITGSEGHPGMEIFTISGQTIFFDGGLNTQGYFWLAPKGHEWKHYEAKTIANTDLVEFNDLEVAPEIAPIKDFLKQWTVKSNKKWFGSRVIDFQHQRIYTVERAEQIPYEKLRSLSDVEREKERNKHYLLCMDFRSNVLWEIQVYSSMWSLFLSPDGEFIFTSIPRDAEVTYLPGHLLILTKDGQEVDNINIPAHGFTLEFLSNEKAEISLASERAVDSVKGLLSQKNNKKWKFIQLNIDTVHSAFGAGLNEAETPTYILTRTDKKKYLLATKEKEVELKLTAAIYEIHETNTSQAVIRTGTRGISIYNENLDKVLEIKEMENITSVVLGSNGFVVLMKKEVKRYDYDGKLTWRYSSLPKSQESSVVWYPSQGLYVWVVSNNLETIVATISEVGKVLKSQSFDKSLYHRTPIVSLERDCFVVQTNEKIEAYTLSN